MSDGDWLGDAIGRAADDAVAGALGDAEVPSEVLSLAYILMFNNTDTDAYRAAWDAANRLGEALG